MAIYTAIYGDYDYLLDPLVVSNKADYICFTDSEDLTSDVWEIRRKTFPELSSQMSNRKMKILPHKFLSEYDKSIYVDGNIKILDDLGKFGSDLLEKTNSIRKYRVMKNNYR